MTELAWRGAARSGSVLLTTIASSTPVHVAPHTGRLHVGFIDEPPVVDAVPRWSSRLGEQRGEALYPPVDGDVIDVDAAFL
jgi:hypothetical protein